MNKPLFRHTLVLCALVVVGVGCGQATPVDLGHAAKADKGRGDKAIPADTVDLRGAKTECEVHGVPLLEAKQDAMPRLTVSWEPEYEKARSSLFPNLGTAPFGIDDTNVKWALVRYCPRCREENRKWSMQKKERKRTQK